MPTPLTCSLRVSRARDDSGLCSLSTQNEDEPGFAQGGRLEMLNQNTCAPPLCSFSLHLGCRRACQRSAIVPLPRRPVTTKQRAGLTTPMGRDATSLTHCYWATWTRQSGCTKLAGQSGRCFDDEPAAVKLIAHLLLGGLPRGHWGPEAPRQAVGGPPARVLGSSHKEREPP
ncbi:hypothetical protein GQ53DRAFT_422579 [Thozetella sp. PMI_491]|nr:hypothetical protein GQ53DRAFT_422579 [Thozetella sp. PMI_491]